MTRGAEPGQWWSATGSWRLLECPASASPAYYPAAPPAQPADNAGAIAHLALQAWAESGEWAHADPGGCLQERFDAVAEERGASLSRMPRAAVTRARLKTRGGELAAILTGAGAEPGIYSELLITDEENQLFGILDIAAPGNGGLVIDLKTGHDASAQAEPAIRHQMTFYAHLFQAAYGMLPERMIVFSLQRGPREVTVTRSGITALLGLIRAAQAADHVTAHPQEDRCRYCPKRMSCEPHWDSLSSWEHPDAVEGEIGSIEHSSSGAAAVLIGGQWLTGIPPARLPAGLSPGRFARAVRVRRRNDGTPAEWAATSSTTISIRPLPQP